MSYSLAYCQTRVQDWMYPTFCCSYFKICKMGEMWLHTRSQQSITSACVSESQSTEWGAMSNVRTWLEYTKSRPGEITKVMIWSEPEDQDPVNTMFVRERNSQTMQMLNPVILTIITFHEVLIYALIIAPKYLKDTVNSILYPFPPCTNFPS